MQKIENNRGQAVATIAIVIIAIVALVAGGMYIFGGEQATLGEEGLEDPTGCPESTAKLTISPVSEIVGAASPSPSLTCGVDGAQVSKVTVSGTTTFPVGAELECLVNATDYIDVSFEDTMTCGGIEREVKMCYATSDNPAIKVTDPNNANAKAGDLGTTGNLTNVAAGASVEFDVEFTGTSTECTGDFLLVMEFPAATAANITKVTMSADGVELTKATLPQLHTLQGAGGEVAVFNVPNFEGATKKTYNVVATQTSTGDLSGVVLMDLYTKQDYVDDDGTIKNGVEDSDGTAKYENTFDYDFYIASA